MFLPSSASGKPGRFIAPGVLATKAEADGQGLVDPVHGALVQPAHLLPKAVLIQGAHLL